MRNTANKKTELSRLFASICVVLFMWKAALDPFFAVYNNSKIVIPDKTIIASGSLTRPIGYRYAETGYEFQEQGREKIILHCGPSPSWDFCIDGAGGNKPALGIVTLRYYLEQTEDGERAVIISIAKNGHVVISADSQLKMWRSYTKFYNGKLGKYVAQSMDSAYWLINLLPISLVLVSTWIIASYLCRRLQKVPGLT
jgi:hypothetical protein